MRYWVVGILYVLAVRGGEERPAITGMHQDVYSQPETAGTGSVLFSNFSGIAPVSTSITCQRFTDPEFDGFLTYGADDFEVPDTVFAWRVHTVEVEGAYFNGQPQAGPAESVNVYILGHDSQNNLPDTTDFSNPAGLV